MRDIFNKDSAEYPTGGMAHEMDLRDVFAAHALTGILGWTETGDQDGVAIDAYKFADAMIERRRVLLWEEHQLRLSQEQKKFQARVEAHATAQIDAQISGGSS